MQQTYTKLKRWLHCRLSLLFFMCISFSALGQTRIITGVVTDAKGSAIPGVTVGIKGDKTKATTAQNGKFQINLPQGNQVLVFRYLGYEEKEVTITGTQKVLNVTLKEAVSQLDNVVVIGYGTTTRRELTGSVGSVNMADLQRAPVKSFDEALAGRVAGVQVTSSEGQPGAPIDIVIRGYNSITQNNSPLFVIDGFPMEDPTNSAVNPLNTIDPNDIESIDVLKDAVTNAIYGARGANGVIMVTTKRGKVGLPTVTYNGYYGWQENKKRMEVLSPYEFVRLQDEIDPIRTKSLYYKNGTYNLESFRNVDGLDWEDQVTRSAPMQSHYLSMGGGTEKTKYNVSLSHLGQDGIIINSGFNRTQGRFSLDQEISKKIKAGINATYSKLKNYGTSTSSSTYSNTINLLYAVWAYRPVVVTEQELIDLVNSGTDGQAPDSRFNPVLTTNNELRENFGNSFNANAYVEYEFSKALKLRLAGGINSGDREYDIFNGSLSRSGSTGNYLVSGGKTFISSDNWQNTNTLTFNKRFDKKHLLNVVGGFSMEAGNSASYGGYSVLIPNESLGLSGADEGTPNSITSSTSNYKQLGAFGRATYTYNSKYIVSASYRADGSSRFIGGNTWGYFPSAGFTWQLGREDFMKKIKTLSSAKIRTSWGINGNNQVGNFAPYAGIGLSNSSGYMFNNGPTLGSYLSSLGNSDLKWENTEQADIGLDLGFLKDRITLTVDAYVKKTYDLLLNADLSPSTGYSKAFKNIGKVKNRGLEFTLSATPVDNAFKWTSDLNISFNRNKLLALTENQNYMLTSQYWGDDWVNIYPYIAKLDGPIAQFYGLVYDGVYGYDDFTKLGSTYTLKSNITANGESRANIKPGDAKFKDLNGDLLVDESDKVIIGSPYPKHTGGLSNNFSYKGFDLNVFLQWSYGNDIINANRIMLESATTYNTNQFASYADRWTPENQNSVIPAALGSTLKAYSTRFVEDGSYLRLKTVSVGYNLSKETVKQLGVKGLRVYSTAQNLYTWTKYSGYDPEVSVRNSALTPGFDYSAYPRARTIVFGLNATF